MDNPERRDPPDFTGLTTSEASRLLALGLSGARRPVDDLLDRLCRPDAAEWLATNLTTGPAGAFGDPVACLVNGQVTLDQLVAVKQSSRSLLSAGGDQATRLTALASYFFSVAAALAHHRTKICSRSRQEIDAVLLDLAAVTAEPWTTLLATAADTPHA